MSELKKRPELILPKTSRRDFLRKAGVGGAAVASTALAAPYLNAQTGPIRWRLQT